MKDLTVEERLNYGEMMLDEVTRSGASEAEKEYWRGYVAGCQRAVEAERKAPRHVLEEMCRAKMGVK